MGSPRIQLRERTVIPLPPTFQPAGATFLGRDTLLVWSAFRPDLVLAIGSRFVELQVGTNEPPIAAGRSSQGIELLFGGSRRLLVVSPEGATLSEHGLSGVDEEEEIAAAAYASGWYVGARRQDGGFSFYALESDGSARSVASLPPREASGQPRDHAMQPRAFHLRAAWEHGDVLAAELHEPFRIFRLSAHGLSSWYAGGRVALSARDPRAGDRVWVALAAVPVTDGAIQSLADLRSDVRLLRRFSSTGVVEGTAIIEAPVGLIATDPQKRSAVAIRITSGREIVLYDW